MVCGLHQVAVSKNFKGESETIKGIMADGDILVLLNTELSAELMEQVRAGLSFFLVCLSSLLAFLPFVFFLFFSALLCSYLFSYPALSLFERPWNCYHPL